jgi:ankyrin repeat protein
MSKENTGRHSAPGTSRCAALAMALVLALAPAVAHAGDPELIAAVKRGDRTAVQRVLVRNPASVNATETDGTTALHWAVQADDAPIVDRLLRAGAKVSAANRYGVTPLALASQNGSLPLVERLLAAGAPPDTRSGDGETALMAAARAGATGVARLLLRHGADVNAREQFQGQTALMWAAAENHASMVTMLLEAGASPDVAGRIFTDHELRPGDAGTPKAPTSKGAMTALHYAAREGALDAVRALLAGGADPDLVDPDGVNALLYATINGHTDVAALLLDKGADPNVADTFGRTILYAVIDVANIETAAPRPAPRITGQTTPIELMKLAIARGAALNAPIISALPPRSTQGNNDSTPVGATPLWRAAKSSDAAAVRLLLAAGADPSTPTRDGVTPLMVAAGQEWKVDWSVGTEDDSIETIRALVAAGVEIDRRNNKGETALHGAADRSANAVVQFLVEQGARLNLRDKSNRTALDVALGVPPTAGRNPFEYRTAYGNAGTAAVLRELMAARGVAIEPYVKPGDPTQASARAGQ